MDRATIFALSSGSLPSGVALIRISGLAARSIETTMLGGSLEARRAGLRKLVHPQTGEALDEVLALVFPAPSSFTGEDVVELHCHGGVATVAAVLDALGSIDGFRIAEAGEFSRRAFENGRLDLTALEGLADLIAAQTETQREQALIQSGGALRDLYDGWRDHLIRMRALIEAELDFADENDVPGSVSDQVWRDAAILAGAIRDHLDDDHRGEIVRDGFRIALTGPPNAGKSSLLNALARRDVAIVTPQAGTTRDVVEVSLDIAGQLVIVSDTAGIRETQDIVEKEGIRRSHETAKRANLVLWLQAADERPLTDPLEGAVIVTTKTDLAGSHAGSIGVTVVKEDGLAPLMNLIAEQVQSFAGSAVRGESVPTRVRHRLALEEAAEALESAVQSEDGLELRSEFLRVAGDALGRITGRVDVEDLLDVIFSEFCIGK